MKFIILVVIMGVIYPKNTLGGVGDTFKENLFNYIA
jgi:hypothetical protein